MSRKYRPLRRRICFGPPGKEGSMYWWVRVRDAKEAVTINGSAEHALKAAAGETIGCAMSNVAKANKSAFPHPVILPAFTKKTCLIVDKVNSQGHPVEAVFYEHPYGHIVDANDKGTLKRMVRENPELMTRSFTLVPPRRQKQKGSYALRKTVTRDPNRAPRGSVVASRGALARAQKAGLISSATAGQLADAVS